MAIETRPLSPSFATEIVGIDLSEPISNATLDAVWSAIDRYAVVVFRNQRLSDAQLRDFSARFGPLEIGRAAARPGRRRLEIPQIGDISNLDVDNNVRALDDRRRLDSLGNRLWHTDASYMPVPVVLGMLHAVALPPPSPFGNGETEFADMRAAYDALPDSTRQAIDELVVEHDLLVARPDRLHRIPPRRARAISALATAAGAPAPRLEAQDALFVRARLPHRRLAGRRWPPVAMGPHRARHAAGVRLQPHLAGRRSGDLG
jgi:alpha-ketoglutarate-dependent taurine dioxygenase